MDLQTRTNCPVPDIPCGDVEEYNEDGLPGAEAMYTFWEDSRSWLARRGVYLYETASKNFGGVMRRRWLYPRTVSGAPSILPYATCVPPQSSVPQSMALIERLGFARDSQQRDLVIKLVDKESDHYRIYECLLRDDAFSDPATFPGALPPIHILNTPHKYVFVTMPMWGELWAKSVLRMDTIGEALHCMNCLLQGLAFLHSHRIAHRDIDELNIMVNCYRLDHDFEAHREDLRKHARSGNAHYALMDFNQSKIFPEDTCVKTCRRPSEEGRFGSGCYRPWDIALGQPTYNPFAFDVGMLGNFFRIHFKAIVPQVPACAALFDRMANHVIPERFTAEEALALLRDAIDTLDEEALKAQLVLKIDNSGIKYWDELSPELRNKWGHYRAPPVSLLSNVLEGLVRFRVTRKVVFFLRRLLNV